MVADNTYAKEYQLVLNRFGATLRDVRQNKDISQDDLAGRCGLHRTEISLLERGLRSPRLSTLLLLATGLEVPIAALVEHLPVPKARRPVQRARW